MTWYDRHQRDLPWREPGTTPWGVLVSEVMLQQTPTTRVAPQWRAWMKRWPTPSALANASTADVLRAWDRLGYPRRALRLQEAAKVIAQDFHDDVPSDLQTLLTLPGVGEYTAAAVACFAYGQSVPVLDTNVRRVIGRAFSGIALPRPTIRRSERELAAQLLEEAGSAQWNISAMELGSMICTSQNPACHLCPLAQVCKWKNAGYPADEFAHKRRTQPWEGTDRQMRGKIMAILRVGSAELSELARQLTGDPVGSNPVAGDPVGSNPIAGDPVAGDPEIVAQFERCLASLILDGLITKKGSNGDNPRYALG